METDSYWRTRCVGEAIDQGYTFLRLTCSCGRITDFPFPYFSTAEASAGTLHRQHRFSLPEVWKHIAAHRGQFAEGRSRALPTMTPVTRDPGGMERRGLTKAAWTPGETGSA